MNDVSISFDRESLDEALNCRYARGEVRILSKQIYYPIRDISAILKEKAHDANGTIRLTYDYAVQDTWSAAQQSRLIESFLMNIPVPPIFLYTDSLTQYEIFEVLDGWQRLIALKEFFDNTLVLTDLQYWRELNGRAYDTLLYLFRKNLDLRSLLGIIIYHETAESKKEVKPMFVERLNTGALAAKRCAI